MERSPQSRSERSEVPPSERHVLVTGGAGYIGSLLCGLLLWRGYRVSVIDDLLFGADSLLPYLHHPRFRFVKGDVCDAGVVAGVLSQTPSEGTSVVHLAAIVGFPACQAVGDAVAHRYNVEATRVVFEEAEAAGAQRFLLSSTYSNYGLSGEGQPVDEESPLQPQSIYAETKIAAEQFLTERTKGARTAPLIYRFATLFGVSPRTRFDLIVNQFVLQALRERRLVIYQRGYARAFVHVRDVCEAICLGLEAPPDAVRGEVFNVGSGSGNHTKDEVVALVQRHVPGTEVEYKDLSFGGDMRDIRVSFEKIRRVFGFEATIGVERGICEVRDAIRDGLIADPCDRRYRNAEFIVQ
jgi:nucleoside-diphosphate-sugar epimerase